jgi:peroxiredoxin
MFKKRSLVLTAVISMILILSSTLLAIQPAQFSMRSLDGQTVTSNSLRGKTIVFIAGASWLPLSRSQVQGIQKVADNYKDRGVEFFWVSTDSTSQKSKNYASDEDLREFARKYNLKLNILRDPDGTAMKKLGVDQVLAYVIIDKTGNVSGAPVCGFNPDTDVSERIARALDNIK